jgi:hypothetical protein
MDHRRLISSKPSTDSLRDEPEGTVCRVLKCLSSLLPRVEPDPGYMTGSVGPSGDQSLYDSEKGSEADRLDLVSTECLEAKRTCLRRVSILVWDNTSARKTYLTGRNVVRAMFDVRDS